MQLKFLSAVSDLTNTHYPYYILLKREILEHHRFPLFNPLIFGGYNLLGDPQSGIFYPFTYLYLFLRFDFATICILLSHLAILFVGTYYVFRKIFKAEKWIGVTLGLLSVLLPKWFYHIIAGHLSMIESLSWFPIIFYFVLKITTKSYALNKKDIILFSVACCLSIFANYFFFYQIALFIGAYLILWIITSVISKKVDRIKPVTIFIIASVIITLIVTGIQIIPGIISTSNNTHINLSPQETIPFWSWKYLLEGIFFPYKNLINFNQEAFLYSGILLYIFAFCGVLKIKFRHKNIFVCLIVIFSIFIINYKFPLYGTLIRLIPGAETLRVTTRFWFFIDFLLLIFLYQYLSSLKQKRTIGCIIIFALLIEYLFIDGAKLNSPNIYGDQKEISIYKYLRDNYKYQKIYTTGAFLSQYYTAIYDIHLAAGENPWQNATYINKLKKAGGYPWFSEYAVIYPPWQAGSAKSQPNATLLRELGVSAVLSAYPLNDSNFQYMIQIDKIKVYENSGFKY